MLGEARVRDVIGIELALDPFHHPEPRDAVGFAGAGAVRESIQRMERRVARRQARRGAGCLRGEQSDGCNKE